MNVILEGKIWNYFTFMQPLQWLSRNIEKSRGLPEVIIVLYDGVSDLNTVHSTVSECLFQQDGAQSWVKILPNILQQTRLTKLNCILYQLQIIAIRILQYNNSIKKID